MNTKAREDAGVFGQISRRGALKAAGIVVGAGILSAYLPGSAQGLSMATSSAPGLSACIGSAGRRHIFGLSPAGALQWLSDESGAWSVQNISGGTVKAGRPAATYRPDKTRIDVFVSSPDGQTWWRTRTAGATWTPWTVLGAKALAYGFDAVIDQNYAHRVFGAQSTGGACQWTGWLGSTFTYKDVSNGLKITSDPAVTFGNGWIDMFGVGVDGSVWRQRNKVGSASWSSWARIGGSGLVALTGERLANGSYLLIGTTSSGRITKFTSLDGTSWTSSDASSGLSVRGRCAILATATGAEVAAVGSDGQAWLRTVEGSGNTAWRRLGGSFAQPVVAAVPVSSAPVRGPQRYATVAEARSALNAPADANYVTWNPTWTTAGLMLHEVFTKYLGANDVLVLPERVNGAGQPIPYLIDSSKGFMASNVAAVSGNLTNDVPSTRTIITSNSRCWFEMARGRRGIIGMGPNAVVEPSVSTFKRGRQPSPIGSTQMKAYNSSGVALQSLVGAQDALLGFDHASPFVGNLTIHGRDCGGVAYSGVRASTVVNVLFDAASRGFSGVPNGETGSISMGAGALYRIENVEIRTTVNGVPVVTSPIMWNRARGGIMKNVKSGRPVAGMLTLWRCDGVNTWTDVSIDGNNQCINLEEGGASFVLNWTGGTAATTGKYHIIGESSGGSKKVTLKGVTVTGGVVPGAFGYHFYSYNGTATQLKSDLVRADGPEGFYGFIK